MVKPRCVFGPDPEFLEIHVKRKEPAQCAGSFVVAEVKSAFAVIQSDDMLGLRKEQPP